MSKPIIAAIDDEVHILVLIEKFFQSKFEVLTYRSGDDFLEKYKNENISTIILDWNMPGRDGIETLNEMKARNICTGVPVAMHTGIDWSDVRMQKAVSAGATIFLHKGADWYFTIYHVEALVNLFQSQKQLNEMTTLISNSMQHNINGWLTGIVTVGSMLPMFPEWGEGPFFDKINQMIESSQQLNKLSTDLSTMLTNQKNTRKEEFDPTDSIEQAIKELAFLKADMKLKKPNGTYTLNINKEQFTRVVYYMGLYMVKSIGNLSPVIFEIGKEHESFYFKCSVQNVSIEISNLFYQSHSSEAQHGTILLAATYIRKSSQHFNATIHTQQETEESFVKLVFH